MINPSTMSPKKHIESSPYEVFLHLMMIAMIIVSVVSLITLVVQYINLLFPDELIWYGSAYDNIRLSSSILLVSFPVFVLTSWLINKDMKDKPQLSEMGVRKWLIYLALFIAALTIVIDLIQFVNSFYSGELTLPFFWKVLTVLLVSSVTFGYLKWDLGRERKPSKLPRAFAFLSSGCLLAILAVGFVFAGSPQHQRMVRLDEERVQDLQSLEYEVIEYWRLKEELPSELSDLERDGYYFELPLDPRSGESYQYQVLGDLKFELCADFDLTSLENQALPDRYMGAAQFEHEAGVDCFEKEIDPDFYEKNVPEVKPLLTEPIK